MKICSNLRSEGISWCFALSIEGSIKLLEFDFIELLV